MTSARWSPTHVRFVVAWAIGLAAIFLMDVHDGLGSLLLPSGLILIWAGVALARNPREWDLLMASIGPRRARHLPGWGRWVFAVGLAVIGAGWALGGVLGVLAIFGLYEYP